LSNPEKDSSAKNASSTGRVSGCAFAACSTAGDGEAVADGEGEASEFLLD